MIEVAGGIVLFLLGIVALFFAIKVLLFLVACVGEYAADLFVIGGFIAFVSTIYLVAG